MKFTLEIDLDNDAFAARDPHERLASELVRVIRYTSDEFKHRWTVSESSGKLRDINGNTCGYWQITEEK